MTRIDSIVSVVSRLDKSHRSTRTILSSGLKVLVEKVLDKETKGTSCHITSITNEELFSAMDFVGFDWIKQNQSSSICYFNVTSISFKRLFKSVSK